MQITLDSKITDIVGGDPVVGLCAAEHRKILALRAAAFPSWLSDEIFHNAENHRDAIISLICNFHEKTFPIGERLREEVFEEAELVADKLTGSAIFRGLLEFVQGLQRSEKLPYLAYDFAVREAVRRENLVGPLSPEEEKAYKLANHPLVRRMNGEVYRLFSLKPVTRVFATAFQTAFARFKKERDRIEAAERRVEEVKRREAAIRDSVSKRDLRISMWGTFATRVRMNGGPAAGYLELEGNGFEVKVVRAEGIGEEFRGASFGRGKLPIELFRELMRGAPRRREVAHAASGKNRKLRFIPGQVKAA